MNKIAYQGSVFLIEWYFDGNSKSQAFDYYLSLTPSEQKKALALFRLMGERGVIRNVEKFNNEGDGIYTFKPQPDRFLCFFVKGKRIIVTNGFRKKTRKLPPDEKQRALRNKDEYESRERG